MCQRNLWSRHWKEEVISLVPNIFRFGGRRYHYIPTWWETACETDRYCRVTKKSEMLKTLWFQHPFFTLRTIDGNRLCFRTFFQKLPCLWHPCTHQLIFRHDGKLLVKRIAAVEGETVERIGAIMTVPEDCYYVLLLSSLPIGTIPLEQRLVITNHIDSNIP